VCECEEDDDYYAADEVMTDTAPTTRVRGGEGKWRGAEVKAAAAAAKTRDSGEFGLVRNLGNGCGKETLKYRTATSFLACLTLLTPQPLTASAQPSLTQPGSVGRILDTQLHRKDSDFRKGIEVEGICLFLSIHQTLTTRKSSTAVDRPTFATA